MKVINLFLVLLIIGGIVNTSFAGCGEMQKTIRYAAREEYEKAREAYDVLIPDASKYSKSVKNCISFINGWTGSIGLKLPSISQLLRMFCDEIRSYFTMPDFPYDFRVMHGDWHSLWSRFEVQQGGADDIFEEVWNKIWR